GARQRPPRLRSTASDIRLVDLLRRTPALPCPSHPLRIFWFERSERVPCRPLTRGRSWGPWPVHESRDLTTQRQTAHLAGRAAGAIAANRGNVKSRLPNADHR